MANINFVNGTLIAGTTFNPGLEDVLVAGGTVLTHNASTFQIQNNSGGALQGFIFQLTSNAGVTGDFAYNGATPTAGTITGINVLAPNGTTHIVDVVAGAGGFGDTKFVDFFKTLNDPLAGKLFALDDLLNNTNTVAGSAVADHASAFGFQANTVIGGGGDDTISAREGDRATLVGGTGNDTFKLSGFDDFHLVAGANQDGTGGAGQTNTVEIHGVSADNNAANFGFDTITNIDALRFVDDHPPAFPVIDGAADLEVSFKVDQISAGKVSPTLAVDGSTTASPLSSNEIDFFSDNDLADRTPVNLNLSGWTFTHWDPFQNEIRIDTNDRVALNDHVVGTKVADSIDTFAGDDTLQGGGGADFLDGGDGNDTFVYGLHEAAKGEFVDGDNNNGPAAGTADKVLVLADNDFTGTDIFSVEQFVFGGAATATLDQFTFQTAPAAIVGDGHANTLAFQLQTTAFGEGQEFPVSGVPTIDLSKLIFHNWTAGTDKIVITGTATHDSISGSTQNDVIDGKGGSDFLQGNGGNDAFLFDTAFGHGVSHVTDFTQGQDILELDHAVFGALKVGVVGKKVFGFGTHATTHKEHIIFDKETGVVRYDDDGKGGHHAHIITVLDDVSALQHGDILVI